MFNVYVNEGDSCAVCQKPGSAENPMVVLSDRRKRRDESSYISFHVATCWAKAIKKGGTKINQYVYPAAQKAEAAKA